MPFDYRIGTEADSSLVYEFLLEHFRTTEPITVALNASREDVADFYADLRDGGLKNNQYSTLVFEGEDLVAICLCDVNEYKASSEEISALDPCKDYAKDITAGRYQRHNGNRIACFVDLVEENSEQLLGPGRVFKIDILCVMNDKQSKGLATSLVRRCFFMAAQSDCKWIASSATAARSAAIFTKFGMRTLREVPFSCYCEDGVPVFTNLPDGGRSGKLMAIQTESLSREENER